jgi:CDP-diacylglycerol--glycerol-3-phosphate 3-phosphatidyltransferase
MPLMSLSTTPASGAPEPSAEPVASTAPGPKRRRLSALLNPPNLLSIGRILLVPVLVAVLLTQETGWEYVGLGIFLLAAATDALDGFLARRRREVTRLGKLLDPTADKILITAAFVSLVQLGLAPAWIVATILAREFAVSALRSLAAVDRLVLAAIPSAKVKTICQVLAISLLILTNPLGEHRGLGPMALWLALAVSLYSGVEYFVRWGPDVLGRRGDAAE